MTINGTIQVTDFGGSAPGDTFVLTIVTDGFSGICTVANGHLISVTGNIDGTPYDITLTTGYPASPTYNPAVNGLVGQGQLGAGGPFNVAIFTYSATAFTIEDENSFASGVFPGNTKRCLQ